MTITLSLPVIPRHALDAWQRLEEALAGSRPPCREGDPDDWFAADPAQAAAACLTCSAREPCAAYAQAADERYGVWGGVNRSPQARRRAKAS